MKVKNRKLKYTHEVEKPIEWWLKGITDPEIREQAFNNASSISRLTNCLSDALCMAFTWSESLEGQAYWEYQRKEIKKEEDGYITILKWIKNKPDLRLPILDYILSHKTYAYIDEESVSSIIEAVKETKEQEQEHYDAPKFNVEALKKK